MVQTFSYIEAFSRNLGWVTADEQERLSRKRIAIAGLGGVGGSHLLTLTRLGVGAFHIADFDRFDIANFNRQAGATVSSLNRPKAEVLAEMAKDINPMLDVRIFPDGVNQGNLPEFLAEVDLYVDGLDYFAFEARSLVFKACAVRRIPATTAAPLGMGAAVLNFLPGKMTFEQYFRLDGMSENEQAIRFLLGLSPAMLQMSYLADKSRVNLAQHRGPSTVMACQLCAGLAATEALKILLHRGPIRCAPRGLHFDAYKTKLVFTWRPWGNHNPIQRVGLAVARRRLANRLPALATEKKTGAMRSVERILDLARWAPSGDNSQVWRFKINSDDHIEVHGFDTRTHCVYDVKGRPSQIALGALLETIRIAATGESLRARCIRRLDSAEEHPIFDVYLEPRVGETPDPLLTSILERCVQRRPVSMRPLTVEEKRGLELALGKQYKMMWIERHSERLAMARLLFKNAKIRLTMPEAYRVHSSVIAWNTRYSDDKVPDAAIGLDPVTTKLMAWVMQSWGRVKFFNTYLAGTLVPRVQLDFIPALACAAHFIMLSPKLPNSIDDYVHIGGALQRMWLTATRMNLQMQPELTPLVFAQYVREDIRFSATKGLWEQAQSLYHRLGELIGLDAQESAVFMGRIGAGPRADARSLRLPLERLMI